MTCTIINMGRTRPLNKPRLDRRCDKCGTFMIGIRLISGNLTPRRVCRKCGGEPEYELITEAKARELENI